MAKNLRQKLPNDDTLFVQDINTDASQKFADELKDFQVVVAGTAREVAEKSVRSLTYFIYPTFDDDHLFSFFLLL